MLGVAFALAIRRVLARTVLGARLAPRTESVLIAAPEPPDRRMKSRRESGRLASETP
jgi:hypothetical protein